MISSIKPQVGCCERQEREIWWHFVVF